MVKLLSNFNNLLQESPISLAIIKIKKNMRNHKYIISLIFILLLYLPTDLYAQHVIKIVDIDSNEPISFALILVEGHNIHFEANADGIANIEQKNGLNYKFRRLGYKEFFISGEQLVKTSEVKMESLPVEINPIIVTADAAWRDLNRAVDNTFNSMPKPPFFLICYQNEKVQNTSSVLINAKSIYVSKVSGLNKKGKGCKSDSKLKALKIELFNDFKVDSLKRFDYYEIPFINDYLVGESKKYDKDLTFYFVDTNDSIAIIGYTPKSKYVPNNEYVLSSGRYIINKENWKLIRIESEVSPKLINYVNSVVAINAKKELFFKSFNRSINFSKQGMPTKLEERLEYSLKNDQKRIIHTNITTQVYKNITEKEFEAVPMKKAERKSILLQKPYFTSTFDDEFEKQF